MDSPMEIAPWIVSFLQPDFFGSTPELEESLVTLYAGVSDKWLLSVRSMSDDSSVKTVALSLAFAVF